MGLADVILFFQELVNYHPNKLLRVKALLAVEGHLTTPATVRCIRDNIIPCCGSMNGRGMRHKPNWYLLPMVLKLMTLKKFYMTFAVS